MYGYSTYVPIKLERADDGRQAGKLQHAQWPRLRNARTALF